MLSRREVLISLSPSMLEVAVPGIRGAAIDRVPLDPAEWDRAWEKGLVPLDSVLAESLARLEVESRSRATVAYIGPDVVAEVFSLPGSPADARQAARLALAEAFPGGIDRCPVGLTVVGRDQAKDSPRVCHLLAVADRDERVEALGDWIRRAGCTVNQLIPAKALHLARAMSLAKSVPTAAASAVLLIAEHSVVIVGIHDADPRVVRLIDFGHDLLTDAVLRAARGAAADRPVPPRDKIAAQLFLKGLPGRNDEFGGIEKLTGTQILPLVQPVLQRLVVEIKQTLRFALEESDLSRVRMTLAGTGATIPGLAALLSEALDANMNISEAAPAPTPANGPVDAPAAVRPGSEIDLLITQRRPAVSLLPESERRRRHDRRAVAGVRIGAAAAVLVLAGLYAGIDRAQRRVAAEIEALAPKVIEARAHAAKADLARQAEDKVLQQIRLIDQAIGVKVDWRALLAELQQVAPADVRLTELQGAAVLEPPTLALKGFALLPDQAAQAPDPLGAYIEHLSRSPLIAGVDMGPTRTAEINGRNAKQFSLTLRLKRLPPAQALADSQPGGAP